MLISKKKLIFGTLGSAVSAGVIAVTANYSGNNESLPIQKENKEIKVKNKLGAKYKKALIEEWSIWGNRFNELKKGSPKNPNLLLVKDSDVNVGPLNLREACDEIKDLEEDSEWFSDFQNFCVMKNKDESNLITNLNDFGSKYSGFASSDKNKLSSNFKNIWENKGDALNDNWKQKMMEECKRLQEKMYVGDTEDKNFESYCTK